MRDCSVCKARAYCWEAVEPGSIMCGINLMQHGGTKSEPETPRTISVKLSPTFCAYCGKPLKIIGTERFCNNVQCFNRFQFVQRKQTSRCRSREHCFHCIKDWLKEESVALRRADDDTE